MRRSARHARSPDADAQSRFAVYQGLIPWAWIEASTKGAVLLFTAAEIETATSGMGISPAIGGLLGGMGGGIVQAYATMGQSSSLHPRRPPSPFSRVRAAGPESRRACPCSSSLRPKADISPPGLPHHAGFCTCMKTAEITRSKLAADGVKPPSTCVRSVLARRNLSS